MARSALDSHIVDLDDRRTWPRDFRRFISSLPDTIDVEDGPLPDDVELMSNEVLRGHLVRAYHCTRLTMREVASVCAEGLVPLSRAFTEIRIANARADGELTVAQEEWLFAVNVASDPNRQGHIFLFTDRAGLSKASSIGWLLSAWGGEGMNMGVETRSPEFRVFGSIGTPTVVVAAVDLAIHAARIHPGVALAALKRFRSISDGTSIVSQAAIDAEYIERIEQPGSEFWNRFVWTPRGGYMSSSQTRRHSSQA
jgi:hypothetical protein